MKQRKVFISIAAFSLAVGAMASPYYSVQGSGGSALPDTILSPSGPMFGGSMGYNIDALSAAHDPNLVITGFEFSVDYGTAGDPGTATFNEAAANDEGADVYYSDGMGGNTLVWDGNGIAAGANPSAPSLNLLEPGDDLDAWENDSLIMGESRIFYSVDTYGMGAEIYTGIAGDNFDATPTTYATKGQLGLGPSENIDALVVFDDGDGVFNNTDYVLFSLGRNAFKAPGSDILKVSAATPGSTESYLWNTAFSVEMWENIDAFDVVPEPSSIGLIAIGALSLYRRKRRRR